MAYMQGRVRLSLDEGVSWTFTGGVWLSQMLLISSPWRKCSKPYEDASDFDSMRKNTSAHHHWIYSSSFHHHLFLGLKNYWSSKCNNILQRMTQAMILKWFYINKLLHFIIIYHFNHCIFNSFIITEYYFIITWNEQTFHSNFFPKHAGASVSHVL